MTKAFNLKTVAHDIRVYAQDNHPGQFVKASIDADRGEVTVFWFGDPPQDIRALAESTAAATVTFVRVPHSIDTLRNEAKRISTEYPYVVSAGPAADYQRLEVRVDESKMTPGVAQISSEVPVNVLPSAGGTVPLRRDWDGSPHSGGISIYNPDSGATCSGGFAMLADPGIEALSTAHHCEIPGAASEWTDIYVSQIYGYQSRRDHRTDSMLLVGKDYQPVVYNGNWQSESGYWVVNWFDPLIGEVSCDSGGLSGEVCGARVNQTDVFIDGTGPGYITDNAGSNFYGSAGPGDSGGPNYVFSPAGAVASGEIVAGFLASETTCSPGAAPIEDRPCYHTIFHTQIEAMSQALLAEPQLRGD